MGGRRCETFSNCADVERHGFDEADTGSARRTKIQELTSQQTGVYIERLEIQLESTRREQRREIVGPRESKTDEKTSIEDSDCLLEITGSGSARTRAEADVTWCHRTQARFGVRVNVINNFLIFPYSY